MFRVLIADDDYEDRELLKLEIQRAVGPEEPEIKFYEAAGARQVKDLLKVQPVDLLTLDIEFGRLNEGLELLPEVFDSHPALNIIVISGKLNKREVTEELFRFTKDNVLKGKRWMRHFDVLDKKDDKKDALLSAYRFALKQMDSADKVRELFKLAESYLEGDDMDRCLDVYQKIQALYPGERESGENISILKNAALEQALDYYRRGEKLVASLLLGYIIEKRLKSYTRKHLGKNPAGLYDCIKELERERRISDYKKNLFLQALKVRNSAVHHPLSITEKDFDGAQQTLKLLDAPF